MGTPTKTQPAIRVNTTTQGDQSAPAAARLPDGRFVIVWQDGSATGGDTSGTAIRGQMLWPDGSLLGTEFLVNTTTQSNQRAPKVAALEVGGFVVVWADDSRSVLGGSGTAVHGQVFGVDGAPIEEEFLIETWSDRYNRYHSDEIILEVAGLANGGFVVGWGVSRLDFKTFDANAQATSPDMPLPGSTRSSGVTLLPTADGGFVIAREAFDVDYMPTYDQPGPSYKMTIVSAAGQVPLSDVELVPPRPGWDTLFASHVGTLTNMPDGRMLLLWRDLLAWQELPNGGRVAPMVPTRGQFLTADGAKDGESFVVIEEQSWFDTRAWRSVTALPDGGFVVVWLAQVGNRYEDDFYFETRLRRFDATGASAGDILNLGPRDESQRFDPLVLTLSDNRIAVIWPDTDGAVSGIDLQAQILSLNPDPLIVGTEGADTLTGSALSDVIEGYGSDDLLQAGEGYDTLFGGDGNDTLQGGGGGGNRLFGDDGNDLIFAGPDGDFIGGGAGDDIIRGGIGRDTIYGGFGNDNIGGGAGNDVIYGAAGHNLIWGGLGDDLIHGALGSDTIYGGGDGTNTIHGGAGDDVIIAGAGGDVIYAGEGDDTIAGGAGSDTIYGGDGSDLIYDRGAFSRLFGGEGDDRFDVTGDQSTLFGGAGNDEFILRGGGSYEVFGGDGADRFDGRTASGNQRIFGEAGHDTITGGAGNDFIGGGAGNDVIDGGAGNDTIWGGFGSDTIHGGAGDDLIFASAGSGNVLYGGRGNDTMVASTGRDVLHSEGDLWPVGVKPGGADVFVFNSAAHIGIGYQRDIIFNFASGEDRIDLRALDTQFNGTAGLLGNGQSSFYHFSRPDMISDLLIGDSQGDGVADWVLEVHFWSSWSFHSSRPTSVSREFLESDFLL